MNCLLALILYVILFVLHIVYLFSFQRPVYLPAFSHVLYYSIITIFQSQLYFTVEITEKAKSKQIRKCQIWP